MPIQLALDPNLPVSARQFAEGWNADPRTDDLASADVQPAGVKSYDQSLGDVVLLDTTQAGLVVSGAALVDLIRDVLAQSGVEGRLEIAQRPQPDGGELLVATVGDKE